MVNSKSQREFKLELQELRCNSPIDSPKIKSFDHNIILEPEAIEGGSFNPIIPVSQMQVNDCYDEA